MRHQGGEDSIPGGAQAEGERKHGFNRSMYLSFGMSDHAIERLSQRSKLSSEELLAMLNSGRTISLGSFMRSHEGRARHLLYSAKDKAFFVAITAPSTTIGVSGTVVTLLTREQYENDMGRIELSYLLRSAHVALDANDYVVLKKELVAHESHGRPYALRRPKILVSVHYFDAERRERVWRARSPNVPLAHLAEHGLLAIHRHPAFWAWLAQRTDGRIDPGVSIDRIEVGAGDPGHTDMQLLDLSEEPVRAPAPFDASELIAQPGDPDSGVDAE